MKNNLSSTSTSNISTVKQPGIDYDNNNRNISENNNKSLWISAVDPKSQRTYWYHRITRESSWKNPNE